MFKIIDIEKGDEGRSRVIVETEDASLFALVAIFESLVDFSGTFRHKFQIASRIQKMDETRVERMMIAQARCEEMLCLYESLTGKMKGRVNEIKKIMVEKGETWITIDTIIAMLTLARRERKEKERQSA